MDENLTHEIESASLAAGACVKGILGCLAILLAKRAADVTDDTATSLTNAELADKLGVSVATVRRMAHEPGAPVEYVGSSPRWNLEAARSWITSRGKKGAAPKTERPDPEVDAIARRAGLRISRHESNGVCVRTTERGSR